jgi:hypothetical protein
MNPSPLGSKFLSAYAILFAGFGPAGIAAVGLFHGIGFHFIANVVLGLAIVFLGIRVFVGNYFAVKPFAILVIVHYLGMTAVNLWNNNDLPAESRAEQMAIPRMLRGVLFCRYLRVVLLASEQDRPRVRSGYDDADGASCRRAGVQRGQFGRKTGLERLQVWFGCSRPACPCKLK